MPGKILLSTAYLPPVSYFSLLYSASPVFIEKTENYMKQSFRNRCYILSPHGPQLLVVPVLEGSRHKKRITDVCIDYSKRWQQVHLRAMISSYKNSPYFDYYFEEFQKIILFNHEKLWDLNNSLLKLLLKLTKLNTEPVTTDDYEKNCDKDYDYRYRIDPGWKPPFTQKEYLQVFRGEKFIADLSIVDLLFNTGPDLKNYL